MTSVAERKRKKRVSAPIKNRERQVQYAAKRGEVVDLPPVKPKVERETPRARHETALTRLHKAEKITAAQQEAGRWFGEVCAEAKRAELPAVSMGAGGCARASSARRVAAITAKRMAEETIRAPFEPQVGSELAWALEAVCYSDLTPDQLVGGNRDQRMKLEERVALGLSVLANAVPEIEAVTGKLRAKVTKVDQWIEATQ